MTHIDGHALLMLQRTQKMFTDWKVYRLEAVLFCKREGMTNQQIGDGLGLSEARIRQILAGTK